MLREYTEITRQAVLANSKGPADMFGGVGIEYRNGQLLANMSHPMIASR